MIKAETILASSSEHAKPLYTLKLRYPWFIHGELLTHRVFSRNASSNRAIPLAKMLAEVQSDELRAEPVFWGAEKKGMEPGGELTGDQLKYARNGWRMAALKAADEAKWLGEVGLHKSLCNRLLMPFTHANVIVTATEWDNFFGLRLDKAADPTMRALTEEMWKAINETEVKALKPGEWHLPFADDPETITDCGHGTKTDGEALERMLCVSVARCARVSYESFETGKRSTVEEDLKLYDRLMGAQPLHASPAEHQATPDYPYKGGEAGSRWQRSDEHGNFIGWRQYRKMIQGESVAPLPEGYNR